MKNIIPKLTRIGLTSTLALAVPALAHAADDYSSTTTDTATGAAAGTAMAGFVGIWLIFFLIMVAVGIAFLIFWIIMLVDAFKRTNWQDESQKTTWLIILIASIFIGLSWLAAILYYFIVKKALGKGGSAPVGPTPPPAAEK